MRCRDDKDALKLACELLAKITRCPYFALKNTDWVCQGIGAEVDKNDQPVLRDKKCTMHGEEDECWIWYFQVVKGKED